MKIKNILFLLGLFLIGNSSFAQYIDWVNAPLNPVAFKYKKEHFNIKGDVYAFGTSVFSKEGNLIFENNLIPKHYLYKNGKLDSDTEGHSYEFDERGLLVKHIFPYMGIQTQTYTYNEKGLLTHVSSTRNYQATYTYDEQGRVIKSDKDGNIKEYSYQKNGDQLLVTEKDFSKEPVTVSKKTYKNGEQIAEGDIVFTRQYDAAGNHLGYNNIVYYKDIENRINELSVVYTAPSSVSINPLYDCKFYINDKKVDFIFKKALNYDNLWVYNPFSEKYYLIKDAFKNVKSGEKQIFSEVFIDSPYAYYYESDTYSALYYKGAEVLNSVYLPDKATSMYNFSFLYVYDRGLEMTFIGEGMDLSTRNYRALQQVSPEENMVYFNYDEQIYCLLNGESINKVIPDIKFGYRNDDILFENGDGEFIYTVPGALNAVEGKVYAGRKYNPATDNVQTASASSVNQSAVANTNTNSYSDDSNNPYSGLSTEAATFMAIYRLTPNKVSSSLVSLHNRMVDQGLSTDEMCEAYAFLFKELYAKDKDAAFNFVLEIPPSFFTPNKNNILQTFTTEEREYVRAKAQEIINNGG